MQRILHPDVYHLYTDMAQNPFADPRSGASGSELPLEFSHGAFRFAHSMSRGQYRINDTTPTSQTTLALALDASSSAAVLNMPLAPIWLVQWHNFFDFGPGVTDPNTINLSQRIGPCIPSDLFDPARFGGVSADTPGTGVMFRDLISAGLAELWSVDALIEALATSHVHGRLIRQSQLLRDRAYRRRRIEAWWNGGGRGRYDRAVVTTLSAEPPLPFFVLFEAFNDPTCNGCRLGVLGSIIVAEAIFGELRNNPIPAEQHANNLPDRLYSIFPGFVHQRLQRDATMASVIQFIWEKLSPEPTEGQFGLI
jgi:hypothetical protein